MLHRRAALVSGLAGLAAANARAAGLYPLATRSLMLDVARAGEALIAVGERGFILKSIDAGATWSQVMSPVDVMLTAAVFVDGARGFAVGHDGTILTTSDAGSSWSIVRQDPDGETPLFDVHFNDTERGYAVGAFGLLLTTTDGGVTWTEGRISGEEPHIYSIARRGDRLWAAGEAGALFESEDDGATWVTVTSSPYEGSYFGLLPLRDGGILLFGLRGNLYRSDDDGGTWAAIATNVDATLQGGVELPEGGVVIAGLGGSVLSSRDGRTFEAATLPGRESLSSVIAVANGKILLSGEGGVRLWSGP